MSIAKRSFALTFIVLAFAVASLAQTKVESVAAAPTASEAMVKAVAEHALRVAFGSNTVELWPAKMISGEPNGADGGLYSNIPHGAFAGIIQFSAEASDFRGQKIAPGTYTLRYATLPSDGNHLGVAPSPDFFLLVPTANDQNPDVVLPYMRLLRLSTRASGTNHPAAFSLTIPAKKSPAAGTDDKGHTAVTFDLTIGGKTVPVAMIVAGTAEQ